MDLTFIHQADRYKKRSLRNGKGIIYLRAYDPKTKKCKEFSTGYRLEPKYWKNGRIVKHHSSSAINTDLSAKLAFIEKQMFESYAKGKTFSFHQIKVIIKNGYQNGTQLTFNAFCEDFVSNTTQKNRNAIKRMVENLNDFAPNTPFDELGYKFIHDFDMFLSKQKKANGDVLLRSTIASRLRALKMLANKARKIGHLITNPFEDYKIKDSKQSKTILALTKDEFRNLLALELHGKDKEKLQCVLDCFKLLCFTGVRIGGFLTLNNGSFTFSKDGFITLDAPTQKQGKRISLPLNKMFKENGSKYSRPEKVFYTFINDPLRKASEDCRKEPFYPYTPTDFNRKLKDLAALFECRDVTKKHISTHWGRKTCATSLARAGADIRFISFVLGHSNIKTTQRYIKQYEAENEVYFQNLNWENA